ncbi:MAG: serine hydrolase domain-containing protein, partial [Bacteroidales bacterium]
PFTVRNPGYPDQKITPHMLLNHSSSLAWPKDIDVIPDFHHFYTVEDEPPLLSEWIPTYILPDGEYYRSSVWKPYPPGEMFLYSNIGTSLLGLIVEHISGIDFRDYCRENILDPLEMNFSSFYLSELDYSLIATPYFNSTSPMFFYTCRHYPAGFLNTNLLDFSKFVMACMNYGELNGNRILKRETMMKMLEIQNYQAGVSYLWDHYIGGAIGHIGGGTGYGTCFEWHPEQKRAFFIFANLYNKTVYHGGRIYELVKYQFYQ